LRVFSRNLLLVASFELILSSGAVAQVGISLPAAPQGPGGQDTIVSSSGTQCAQSINSNRGYVDVGVAGSLKSEAPPGQALPGVVYPSGVFVRLNERDREALAYARVTIPLGRQPKRIDCATLYELEIEKLRAEVAALKTNAKP